MPSKVTETPYLRTAFRGGKLSVAPPVKGMDAVNKSVLKELLEDNIDSALIRKEIEELTGDHHFLPVTCRQRLLHFLHSLPVQIVLIVLIIVDVCTVLSTIIIQIFVDQETLKASQQISDDFLDYLNMLNSASSFELLQPSINASLGSVADAHAAILGLINHGENSQSAGSVTSHRRRKRSAGSSAFPPGSLGQTLTNVTSALHYIGIAILAVLVLEVLLKIGAHGKKIMKYKIGIVDGIVNIASLIIDIVISGSSGIGAIGRVLVILTLIWQVFRILNAIVITSQARAELRIKLLKKAKAMHEEKLDDMTQHVTKIKSEIERLCHIAMCYGVPQYELKILADSSNIKREATKFGIQNSLFQMLRLNDAITRNADLQNQQPASATAVLERQRRSLPFMTSIDGSSGSSSGETPTRGVASVTSDMAAIRTGLAVEGQHPASTSTVTQQMTNCIPGHQQDFAVETGLSLLLSRLKAFQRRRTWPRSAGRQTAQYFSSHGVRVPQLHDQPSLWYEKLRTSGSSEPDLTDPGSVSDACKHPTNEINCIGGGEVPTPKRRLEDSQKSVDALPQFVLSISAELSSDSSSVKTVSSKVVQPVSAASSSRCSPTSAVGDCSAVHSPAIEACHAVKDFDCKTEADAIGHWHQQRVGGHSQNAAPADSGGVTCIEIDH